eukprot:SAG11_NODE_440_length_9448_cov_3.356509_2_plen_65_part_00
MLITISVFSQRPAGALKLAINSLSTSSRQATIAWYARLSTSRFDKREREKFHHDMGGSSSKFMA